MADFNPDAPCVVGLQWPVVSIFNQAVNKDAEDRGTIDVLIEAQATETIDSIYVFNASDGSPLGDLASEGWYAIEIYDVTDLGQLPADTSQYLPSDDAAPISQASVAMPSGGLVTADFVPYPGPYWDKVDNFPPFSFGVFNGVQTQKLDWVSVTGGLPGVVQFFFGGIVGDLTGEQILVVKTTLLADMYGSGKATRFRPFMQKGPRIDDGSSTLSGPQPEGGRKLQGNYFADPELHCSWTVDEFENFDDSIATAQAGFTQDATGDDTNFPAVLAYWLEVLHRPEARVAVGCRTEPGNQEAWVEFEMEQPDGTPGWPKVSGTDYIAILRRRGGTVPEAGLPIPVLLGAQPNHVTGQSVTFDGATHAPKSVNGPVDGGPGIILLTSGNSVSVDSQPYTALGGQNFPNLNVDLTELGVVDIHHTLDQVLVAQATDDYGYVTAMIAAPEGLPNEQLEIRLMNSAGTVTVAGPILIEPEDFGAFGQQPPNVMRIIEEHFPVIPTLVNGTQYRLRFQSSAVPETPWRVQALDIISTFGPALAQARTYGGATERVFVNSAEYVTADLVATLAIVPDTPTGLTATASEELDCISSIDLEWDPPVISCGVFAQWEIERSEDGGTIWQRIANITDPTILDATDLESLRNVLTRYRIRVRREDGTPSLWSAIASATATMTCCGYLFASNHYPGMEVWYDDLEHRSYDFLDDRSTRLVPLSGRDYQVAFYDLAYRGVELTPTMLIAAEGGQGGTVETTIPGQRTFDPLRELAGKFRNQTTGLKTFAPSIAVMSAEGDRWFSHVQTPRGERHEPDGAYTMPIIITEVSAIPAPFDSAVPPS